MINFISVVLPTYNPKINILDQTLEALKIQTLPKNNWELIIVDNNSTKKLDLDLKWHPNSKIVFEPKQGLTFARLTAFKQAAGELIIMVDDDNLLKEDYLKSCVDIFSHYELLGAAGGKSLPHFEIEPPKWIIPFYGNLALRDLGEKEILENWNDNYPVCAPIGAGMAIRKTTLASYLQNNLQHENLITDRSGNSLTSGGDNDIVIEILKSGYSVGYFPILELIHLIPKERLEFAYFSRLIKDTNKSWVQLLDKHQISPWKKIPKWTVALRKIKAWFINSAWKDKSNYLKWKASCGYFEGLSK